MRSAVPKVLHEICGRPMIAWPVLAAQEAGAERVYVIVSPERDLSAALPEGTETVVQPESDGTGGAVRAALDAVRGDRLEIVTDGVGSQDPVVESPKETDKQQNRRVTVHVTPGREPRAEARP